MLLFVAASHLLLLCFMLHLSLSSAGGSVSCLEQFLPPSASSYSLQDEQLRLLRIQILPDTDAANWSLSTGSLSSYSTSNSSVYQRNPGLSFIYAPQKSLLGLLEHADALQEDVKVDTLFLPKKSKCFEVKWLNELPLWTVIRDRVIGYDTILVNQLVNHFGARGVLYKEDSRTVVDMSYGVFNPVAAAQSWLRLVAMKFKILHTILFLFFVITALVAFVLLETQKRMITFAALFQNRQQLQIPLANLVLTIFAQSLVFVPVLVGMLFFLFELYKDRLLAFGVMTIMWVGESFSVISVRTRLSQAYFPPLFFCLFTLFHIYLFSFPFGFSYVVLTAMSILLLQLMLFFWNCFEIPALNRGEISRVCPREQLFLSFSFKMLLRQQRSELIDARKVVRHQHQPRSNKSDNSSQHATHVPNQSHCCTSCWMTTVINLWVAPSLEAETFIDFMVQDYNHLLEVYELEQQKDVGYFSNGYGGIFT